MFAGLRLSTAAQSANYEVRLLHHLVNLILVEELLPIEVELRPLVIVSQHTRLIPLPLQLVSDILLLPPRCPLQALRHLEHLAQCAGLDVNRCLAPVDASEVLIRTVDRDFSRKSACLEEHVHVGTFAVCEDVRQSVLAYMDDSYLGVESIVICDAVCDVRAPGIEL